MPDMPKDSSPDATRALLRDGYDFIRNRCRDLETDVFMTRIGLEQTICMRGAEAARLFSDTERFQREGAAPSLARKTLFGEGGVQGLDGEPHRHRKAMFMSLMTAESVERMADIFTAHWRRYIDRWRGMDEVVLFDESSRLITEAICEWAGVPLPEQDVDRRTEEFLALIEGAGSIGLRQWRGRRARSRSEAWLADLVEKVRDGTLHGRAGSALRVIAEYRGLDGELLEPRIAAVELNNVLRPTVAVGRWIAFSGLALHEYPHHRERLRGAGDDDIEHFVQEVRRYYPFFPFVGALVRHDFEWNGYTFPEGTRVLLDLWGTDHHPDHWRDAESFRPERFRDEWSGSAYDFIPQGGGDFHLNHRCPGEWITIAIMKRAVRELVDGMEYDVPEQDLDVDMTDMPTLPESGFVIRIVRRAS
jgi:fatty-acid peroxygenase